MNEPLGITGDLSVMDLPAFLQSVAQQESRGTLVVRHGRVVRTLAVEAGRVRVVPPPPDTRTPRPLLGEVFLAEGSVTEVQLLDALREQSIAECTGQGRDRPRIGEALVTMGTLDETVVEPALRTQVLEDLFDMCSWRTGRFEFRRDEAPPPDGSPALPIQDVLLRAVVRLDESREIGLRIPSVNAVPMWTGTARSAACEDVADAIAARISGLIDGWRTVGEVVKFSPFPEALVRRVLAQWVTEGHVRLGAPKEDREPAKTVEGPVEVWLVSNFIGYGRALASEVEGAGIRMRPVEASKPPERLAGVRAPHVIVLDPGDRRIELSEWRRLADRTGAALLLMMAQPSRDQILQAVSCGVRDILLKPVPIDALVRQILRLAG